MSSVVQDADWSRFLQTIQQFREPAMLLRLAQDGVYEPVFVTEQFATLMECSVEEAMKFMADNGYLNNTNPEDRIFVRRMLRRHVNEDGGSNLIVRKTTTKGHELYCDIHYSFFTNNADIYVYCTYADITLLKKYEQRLHSAYANLNDNFYQILDSTLGLFRVNLSKDIIEDMQGRELFSTDSSVTSYSSVLLKRAESCLIPHEREEFLETFDPEELLVGYLKGRAQASLTYYSRRPNGSSRYVRMTANTTRHPMTGDIIAFLSEETANQIKVKETLLDRILVRQFDMVAWLCEEQYGVVIGDAALIERGSIFPMTRTGNYIDYLQAQVQPVLYGSNQEQEAMYQALLPETIAQELHKASPYVVNIAIMLNAEIWYKRFSFYLVDPEANFYVALKSDTTDLQREQMRVNTQLKLALSEAKQANVAKTAFLSRMSHEIRTPMNAIIGLGTLAIHEPELTPSLQRYLSKISTSAKYLLSLINDILDMSRIESGRMDLKKEEFSFSNFLDLVNTMADGQCRDRELEYECIVNSQLADFYIGDDTKLRQVLINILGNAVKFTSPGGRVSLTVEQVSSFNGQATLRFSIADTGIGMDKEYLPKLFEPFSQEDSSNTSKYGGSGLGLAITKNIITLMNGDITVDSEKGKGSTFTITVSLKEVDKKQSAHSLNLDPKDLRVLIIDDDPVACKHTHIVLEEIGIASETCLSGPEALKLISTHHARCEDFNLILVDLRMPEQDGIVVSKAIREMMGDVATIIITAYSWLEVEQEARAAGVDSFLAKPVFASTVLQEFKQILQRKQQEHKDVIKEAKLEGRRILLAEDVQINAEIMIQLLDILQISVDHVENGQLAVEKFKSQPVGYYDAILMDVRMPVMDGLAATKAIRALDKADCQLIPIISMTANAFDEDVQLSMQAGMNAHLTKPVEPELLEHTLAQLIAKYDLQRGNL